MNELQGEFSRQLLSRLSKEQIIEYTLKLIEYSDTLLIALQEEQRISRQQNKAQVDLPWFVKG